MKSSAQRNEIQNAEIVKNAGSKVNNLNWMEKEHKVQNQQLNVRYCHKDEVNRKRQTDINNKSKFLTKMVLLKRLGKDHQLMRKLDFWLEDNID